MYRPPKVRPKSNDWRSVFFMAKYSFEFKKQLVKEYLSGQGSFEYLAKLHGMPDKTPIQNWVQNYQSFGEESLLRSRQKKSYSFEKKLSIVELYLSSEISYDELAVQEGISNPAMIASWVKRVRAAGPDALRPHKKGRKKTLDKPKINNKPHVQDDRVVDTSAEHVKELEDELLKLRIENAFLKELRRLRLEDEEKMREWRSSSTVSEESSN